jgi:ketosteroid isomerase-like protein
VARPSVEDRVLIHDLYARYSWALDTGDTEGYVRLYTPDAVVLENVPEGVRRVEGHDAIREFTRRFHGNPDFPGRQHRISQIVISPDPEGRADHRLVRSYVLATQTKDGYEPTVFWCGYGEDVVRKVDGEWLISRREIKPWGTHAFTLSLT